MGDKKIKWPKASELPDKWKDSTRGHSEHFYAKDDPSRSLRVAIC